MTETQPVINPDPITPSGADYNPPVDPSSSPTSHVLPIIISSLVTILVLVGGYFLFMSKSPKNIVLNSTPSPTIELASPSPLTDPTANWKTYTNDKYNFSFQYPLDASLYDSINQVGDRIIIQNYSKNSLPKSESADFQLVVFLGDAISDKLDSYPKVWEKELGKRPTELLTVGGLDAIRGYSGQKQEAIPTVWIIKGKYLFTIQLSTPTSSNKKYFDQILSTFKFISNEDEIGYKQIYGKTVVVFVPPLSNPNFSEERNDLVKNVVEPYIEYYNDKKDGNYIVSLMISMSKDGSKSYPYNLVAIVNDGGQAYESLSKDDDGFWWIPTCMGKCPVTDAYRNKYPDLMKLAE